MIKSLISFAFVLMLLGRSDLCDGKSAVRQSFRPFDVVILHGRIMDGTGSPWYAADLGIRDGRIAAIGRLEDASARRFIDAHGMVVAPGFIDMLGQSEMTILVDPHLPSKIYQGITTEITGEGGSIAPLSPQTLSTPGNQFTHYRLHPDWLTFDQYFARLERQGIGINFASYIGATTVREMVLGEDNRAPSIEELGRMRAMVSAAMRDGAIGLSTALEFAPAPFASTEELIALASEAARYGGIYATHMRSEGDAISAALDETIRIGREAHIPVEIWHLKAFGKPNWGRMPEIIAKIEAARTSGIDIAADTYAYTAGFNELSSHVPPWAHEGGVDALIARLKDPATRARIVKEMQTRSDSWDNEWLAATGPDGIIISVVQNPVLLPLQGKTLAQIAAEQGKEPIDALLDLLVEDSAFTRGATFSMDESDVSFALVQPWVSFCTDSEGTTPEGLLGKDHPHPRAYATFPRVLRKYVHDEHKLSLEEAIRKFSALPAARMRLADRGVLKQGMWADVVVFDPDKVTDLATFDEPNQLSVGINWVLVNGVPVIADRQQTNALPGHVLRGQGYRRNAP